jgi:hypothetical protein
VINTIKCKRTGEGLAFKLGGGLCLCRPGDCAIAGPEPEKSVVNVDRPFPTYAPVNPK